MMLERLRRCNCDDERVGVGVADVLEARMTMRRAMKRASPASSIAASSRRSRRGRRPHRLDERGGEVVVLVSLRS